MKALCQREKLLAAFQTAASVAPLRSPKAILQNVKLEATEQGTTLTATDLEIGVRIVVPGIDVESPGTVVLPIGRFGMILRESTDEKLRLESDSQGTLVRGERSEFNLASENPEEFPVVASFNEAKYHDIPARLLKEMIRRTIFATDNESTRYALGGVLLEFAANRMTAVATDGRRLAKMDGPAQTVGGHGDGAAAKSATIVPTKSMQLIERALLDSDAEVQLAARENDILVRSPRVTIYSRLVEGRFPRWRDVFPQRNDSAKIPVTAGPFHAAVRQAMIVTSEESRGVDFKFADGTLVMAARVAEVGQARVELPVSYDGPPLAIMLDPRFVVDFLKVLDPQDNVTVDIKDSDSAAVLSTDDGYGYVVMPLARDR
jgi:DNA polymerase-3 subunit beta